MSLLSSVPFQTNAFSTLIRLQARWLAGGGCWACGAANPEVFDVFAKEDTQVPLWAEAGLLNFKLDSIANAIPLCGLCYSQFGQPLDPGFIFMPVDLQYFIDFELRDRERRSTDGSLRRQVPTSAMYRAHLLENGTIQTSASSGLYRRIFLKDYVFADFGIHVEELGITTPKEWHGAPIATLRRAFQALGSGRILGLDRETVNQLTRLRDLYFRPTEDDPVNLTG